MEDLKVAFVVGRYPVVSEVFILNAAAGLLDRGARLSILPIEDAASVDGPRHSVQDRIEERAWIATPSGGQTLPARLGDAPRIFRDLVRRHGIGVVAILNPFVFGRSVLRLWPAVFLHALGDRTDYDVIHCQFGHLAAPILALRRLGFLKGAVVVHFRGYDITVHVRAKGEGVYRDVFREADGFLANSRFFHRRAVELGCDPDRIATVSSPCDLQRFGFVDRSPPESRPVRLVSVGRLVEKKGFGDAVRAIALLRERGLDVHLRIIGEGPWRGRIEEAIAACGVGDRVDLAGERTQEEIRQELAAADIFIACSVTARSGDQDGPVNTLKEAMATGLPVVATRHGGITELVTDGVTGLLVEEGDPADLADRIAELIAEPARWRSMGLAGRAAVEAVCSVEGVVDRMLDVYHRALLRAPHLEKRRSVMSNPERTRVRTSLVVVPRERFGEAERSLDDMLKAMTPETELIYVSGRTPKPILEGIDRRAAAHGFRHIKVDRHLIPNEARNIGAAAAAGEYVVFVDNDVYGKSGWLTELVACADETGADVVAPLTCHGAELHAVVHQAGGEFAPDPAAFFAQPHGEREIVEIMTHQDARVADVALERMETQLCEFHCVLVRRSVFGRIGPLDEEMMATKEHLDLCMGVISTGGKVVFEPKSVVTYVFPHRGSPVRPIDWPFFLLRWSPEWQKRSLRRLKEKWGLKDTGYLTKRGRMLTARHDNGIIRGTLRRIPVVGQSNVFLAAGRKLLSPVVQQVSRLAVALDDRTRRRARTLKARQGAVSQPAE